MTARLFLIVNPRSANRSTGRLWPKIEGRLRELLPAFEAVLTTGPGDATRLAREAAGKYEAVVAMGGDGTVGEVVNGLVDNDRAGGHESALGVIPRGTGCDFVRSIGVPATLKGAAAILSSGRRFLVDLGRAHLVGPNGAPSSRYFVNAAEVGSGAVVSDAVNRASRRLSGPPAFWWAIIVTALRYRDQPVSLSVDGSPPEDRVLNNAWIANGRYSGGGIKSAPRAHLDDGLLDLVLVSHAGPLRRFTGLLKLRSGEFVNLPEVDYRQARRVEFTAATPVPVETDGDLVGTVPATFEALPSRLTVIGGLG